MQQYRRDDERKNFQSKRKRGNKNPHKRERLKNQNSNNYKVLKKWIDLCWFYDFHSFCSSHICFYCFGCVFIWFAIPIIGLFNRYTVGLRQKVSVACGKALEADLLGVFLSQDTNPGALLTLVLESCLQHFALWT